jgi:hypothetical protein
MDWQKILYFIGVFVVIGLVIWMIRSNPQMFTREKLSKSFFTMGILALLLIGFITLLVFLLRNYS